MMTVTLSEELEELIDYQIASGRYESAEEVLREALKLLEEKSIRISDLEAVKRSIAVGLDQARRGELLDGDEVFKDLDQMLEEDTPQIR